ncbi:hypothetical protein Avbf_09272, partial [Armadillidium vulgare]
HLVIHISTGEIFIFLCNNKWRDYYLDVLLGLENEVWVGERMYIKSLLTFCLVIGINHKQAKEEEEESDEMYPDTKYEAVPNCLASKMWWPVCASNGKNYANLDVFECARKIEPDLHIVNEDGPCTSISSVERNEIKRR